MPTGIGELDLITMLVQGGFAAAFFWLVIDTRRESSKREEKLVNIIQCYGEQLKSIADSLHDIKERIERIEVRR